MNKTRVGIIVSICVICGLFSLGSKSCINRSSNKVKNGSSSSNNTFIINPPLNLSATAVSFSQIDLSWQDNSNNEDGFEIERSTNGIDYLILATVYSNVASYSDSGLTIATTYYYRVRAFNTIGDRSEWSNIVLCCITL